uniref:phage holin family protein n=1 Tax=Roseivirga sp. TaxID=1964215 RepID=UPI00404708E8
MKIFDFHKVIEAFNGFLETKFEILKLDAREEIEILIAKLLVLLLVGLFSTMVLLFMSLAAAYAISEWLQNSYVGFLIVGSVYLVIAIALYLNKSKVIQTILDRQRAAGSSITINEEDQ